MDTRNVIAAISLSAAVIILYGLFFAPPSPDPKQVTNNDQNKNNLQLNEAPKIEQNIENNKISRSEAINKVERIFFENENIKGSISLEGSLIDDLIFKKYTETLDSDENVVLLNPKESENGYYEKEISIDDKFLFTVNQKITNNTQNTYNFYPYGQIIRNLAPDVTDFYILHEGLLGVFDDNLVEEDYDDIKDKKYSVNANKGWMGITKYWITSLIPESNKSFRSDFDYKNKFKANFIETAATEVRANESKTNQVKVIIAAKEVDVVDGYAEKLNINKFDLAIDWGFLYFLTKPIFLISDYFFKLTGNYGIAIILITACIRILFFPLANYSFRSMAKMKVLQPEMVRLKELHKEDKMKLQQEMMALYKREKVNPVSGCLPILIQIPFFFAIYKMLFVTIEMRHQPFFGWIHDLSERDPTSLFNLFGLLPYDVPSFLIIGAWPVAMGVTMWMQQKLNPTPPDPIQQKIFMFFPVFLTVILAPFPSGLVIYWTINNVLTMAQQYVIMKRTSVKTV